MQTKRLLHLIVFLALVCLSVSAAWAEIKLPALVGSNMVLQCDMPVPVWGWAEPGETVTVRFAGQSVEATAGADGRWQATLAKLKTGKPAPMVIEGSKSGKVVLKNVLVGEVWLCSGQSNMDMSTAGVNNAKAEIAAAKYPKIRLFKVNRELADKPKDNCVGQWVPCSPKTVPGFSAVGYFFGRELQKDLNVPIGLIQSAWGGTPAESWTAMPALEAQSSLAPLLARWEKQVKKDKRALRSPHRPSSIFNAMIAPLVPYTIRGVIWYQGESNATRAYQYRTIFPTMIRNWREIWGQPELPFGFVQIAPYQYNKRKNPRNVQCCPELWEAQLLTLKSLPVMGMAVTTDIGNINNIHPKNKQDVGKRLGLWARATVYGKKDLVYSGPIYRSMKIDGDTIRLTFDHVGGGLSTSDDKPLSHFTIAGKDQQFHPAQAKIDGDTIVVSSDQVKQPVAVRFGWHETAEPNLVNKEGLPASPFRTDSWKGVTEGNH
ncbi:MAG: 9-O-acetylesterase [Pirellulales bacterium]|nr:9-O-acetylesterase [Pirellulales bacterium]